MALKLPISAHTRIRCMIENGGLTNRQIAIHAKCSTNAVKAIKRNVRDFGSTMRPSHRGGRPLSISAMMRAALFAHLDKHPGLYLEEMVDYLWNEFGEPITKSSISRTLHSVRRSKKKFHCKVVEQNSDLIDHYLHSISSFTSYQFLYVDESGCDTRDRLRRTRWSLRGVTPVQARKCP